MRARKKKGCVCLFVVDCCVFVFVLCVVWLLVGLVVVRRAERGAIFLGGIVFFQEACFCPPYVHVSDTTQ